MAGIDIGLIITAANNATAALRGTADDVKKIGENAQATANRLKAINVVIAGIAIEKTRQVAESFLKISAATQLLDVRLAAFAGGVPQAQAVWKHFNEEFGATPFKIDAITGAWIKLQAVTGNSARSTQIIEAVVNAVSALPDGTDSKINNLTVALQRVLATGQVEGRQFKAIIEDAGLSVGDLAHAAGESTKQMQRELADGFVSADRLVAAFVKASNDKFGDFGANLAATLGGAMQKVENDFSGALSELGARTNINDRLVLVFRHLSEEIVHFIDNIDQAKVDAFFDFLQKMEPTVRSVIALIANLATIVGTLTATLADFVNKLPTESRELGIVGYALFGVKGAIIGAMLGEIWNTTKGWYADTEAFLTRIGVVGQKKAADLPFAGADTKGIAATGGNDGKGVFGATNAELAELQRRRALLTNRKPSIVPTDGDSTIKFEKALEAANRLTIDLQQAMDKVVDDVTVLNAKTSGDELGAKLGEIVKQTGGWLAQLEDGIKKESAQEVHTQANINLVRALRAEEEQVNAALEKALEHERAIFAIKTQQFALEQKIARQNIAMQVQQQQIQYNFSSGFNFLSGTEGGALELQVMQTRLQLQNQITEAEKSQKDIELQIAELGGPGGPNAGRVDELEKTKNAYNDLIAVSHNALQNLSADALAQQQLWKDLGNTLNNDVADGIKGLIQGTMTLQQVATKVWSDITDLVIKYLLKLAEAKLMQDALGSSGGLGGGGFSIGSLLGGLFANGGAFNGSVKAFANGDVITGPTMFGIAGEAGNEAIMPLTRIGGKLGVRSAGGAGNTYNINVHAIDTQSGMEFVGKHIDTIDQGLQHRRTLHRAGRGDM